MLIQSDIWKPSKNHWKQWSGGWKSLNGACWMTPQPLKNHRVQWSVTKKVVNGDGQRAAKPSKNHWSQWFSQEKTIVSHRSKKMTIVHLYLPEIDVPFDNECNFQQKIGNSICRFPEGNVPKSSLVFFFNFNRGLNVNVFIRLLLGWLRHSCIACTSSSDKT